MNKFMWVLRKGAYVWLLIVTLTVFRLLLEIESPDAFRLGTTWMMFIVSIVIFKAFWNVCKIFRPTVTRRVLIVWILFITMYAVLWTIAVWGM